MSNVTLTGPDMKMYAMEIRDMAERQLNAYGRTALAAKEPWVPSKDLQRKGCTTPKQYSLQRRATRAAVLLPTCYSG